MLSDVCVKIDSQQPNTSLLSRRLYRVGNCDKRVGTQTVREFTRESVKASRNDDDYLSLHLYPHF